MGSTLVVIAIAAILAFTVSAVSLNHLNFSSRVSNGRQAQNIAESVVNRAIAELFKNAEFGKIPGPEHSFEILPPTGGVGRLTFQPTKASAWGIPYSTNNLLGSNPIKGFDPNRAVPKAAVQLVGVGTFHGVTRRVETVLYVPPFPYAIASAAPFRSSGGLQVGSVNPDTDLIDTSVLDPDELLSANLASNAAGSKALILGPNSTVTGDVRSVGEVVLDAAVQVGGEVRMHASPISIPKEDVTSYDPLLLNKPNLQTITPGVSISPVYQGFSRCAGDLVVANGLYLDNGVLYVDGNLIVDGGIQGSGAVFVTKATTIKGTSQFATDNAVAIMSGGDVLLDGLGKYSSFFQGMLYTEGSFIGKGMTLLGVFIQNGSTSSVVDISDSRIIRVEENAEMQITAGTLRPGGALKSANIYLGRDGKAWNGTYGNGPIVFEAYPVGDGRWELADPTTGLIYPLPNRKAVGKKIDKLFRRAERLGQPMLGLADDTGAEAKYMPLPRSKDTRKWIIDAVGSQIGKDIPDRKPGASSMFIGKPNDQKNYDLNPSRFLSWKDRARVLYWRAR